MAKMRLMLILILLRVLNTSQSTKVESDFGNSNYCGKKYMVKFVANPSLIHKKNIILIFSDGLARDFEKSLANPSLIS